MKSDWDEAKNLRNRTRAHAHLISNVKKKFARNNRRKARIDLRLGREPIDQKTSAWDIS